MDHIAQIAGKLADHQLDAMLLASQAGERYAVGFHGEGLVTAATSRRPGRRCRGLRWSW